MLIKDPKFVLTPKKVLEGKNIVVKDNRIKSIGGSDKKGKVIDGSNYAVIPGLINMHTHSSMNLFRGYSDDKDLQEWLQEDIWPLEEKLDGDACYWGSKLAFLEMMKTGTTCFNDMYFFMDRVAEAAEEVGIRGFLGHGMIDLNQEEKRKEDLKETERVVKTLKNNFSDRIRPTIAPHSIETCSEELLRRSNEMAKDNDLLMHMHLSETSKEVEKSLKDYGKRPVNKLRDMGLLDEKFIGAHGVHLNSEEIEILSRSGASLVHNPCSNMKLASGVAPLEKILQKKVNLCIGTDGVASNNNLNLFEELKFASLLQKVDRSDPTAMPISQTIDLPYQNASRALDKKLGAIKVGSIADLVLIDLDDVKARPLHNLRSNLIYSGASVNTVIIDGKIVLKDKKPTNVDDKKVYKMAEKKAQEIKDD